jgi:hypothetical protein
MADTFYFSRDTKVHLTDSQDVVYNIPVLDGFSFSQATNTTEVTLNEMATAAGVSRRARQMFTDSYAPAEWSFSTYIRPFTSAGGGTGGEHGSAFSHVVEEALWNALAGSAAVGQSGAGFSAPDANGADLVFTNSNKTTLDTFDLHFEMGSGKTQPTIYKIEGCVVNEVSIDFDIDGIATANWSGFGQIITEASSMPTATIYEGTAAGNTANFIRNRLTDLTVEATADGEIQTSYDLTLTGGNITIGNNITFLTPETLGIVNQPLGHVTGTRNVSGNFTCYLNSPTGGGDSSADLFEDIIESTSVITNDFNLVFVVGGTISHTAGGPSFKVTLPTCHLEVPTHSIDDIVSLETTFHALPTSVDGTDEATFEFKGPALT